MRYSGTINNIVYLKHSNSAIDSGQSENTARLDTKYNIEKISAKLLETKSLLSKKKQSTKK
jgi:hypothetical protein